MKRYRISFYSIAHTLIGVIRASGKTADRAIQAAYIRADWDGLFISETADYAIDQNGTTYRMQDLNYTDAYSIIAGADGSDTIETYAKHAENRS